jgi:hypothetical protein
VVVRWEQRVVLEVEGMLLLLLLLLLFLLLLHHLRIPAAPFLLQRRLAALILRPLMAVCASLSMLRSRGRRKR